MNAKHLVVLLALLVGAVIATLALRGDGDAGPTPPGGASGQGADAAALERAALVQGTAGADQASLANAGDAQRTAAPLADAGKAGGQSVMIRGRLVDKHKAPRAGVELVLMTWPGFDDFDGFDFEGLPSPTREGTRQDRPKFTTRTDGTFSFTIAKDRSGMLELESADLIFAAGSPRVNGKKGDQDLGDVTAVRSAVVTGIVQDEHARPVADVKVAASIGSIGFGASSNTSSASDGTFKLGKLRPGKLTIRTASGKFLPTVQEIDLEAEEQRSGLVLVVRPGDAIAGQVIDDRGVGVAGMKVGSKRKEKHGTVDIERFAADEATVTDANGYFTLSGLSEETATVRVFGPGHSSAVAADVAVGTGNLVLRVERFGIVEGVLQGQDGTPIAGSRVGVQGGRDPQGLGEGVFFLDGHDDMPDPMGRGAVTAADGTFRIESVKPGTVTVTARGPTHQPVRQPGVNVLPAQATKGVRLVADLGAIARVKVVDEAGKPVADAQVRARRVSEDGPTNTRFEMRGVAIEDVGNGPMVIGGDRLASGKTNAEGIAVLQGLPAANLELTATHGEYAPSLAARVTTPKSGTVEAELQLRTPGHALVTVLGTDGSPQPGVELQVQAAGENRAPAKTATSDDKGEARVGPLAPGTYTAALRRPNQATRVGDGMMVFGNDENSIAASAQPFTVVAGETVRVEVRRPLLAKVHGTLTGMDGPAAGCSVELVNDEEGSPGVPGFGGRNATTAGDGTFTFDDVESGNYRLHFGKPNQVVKAVADLVVPPNTPDVRRDLELRTGTLRVQVVSEATGEPIEKADVEIARAEADTLAGQPPRRERRMEMVTLAVSSDGGEAAPDMTSMTLGIQRAQTDEGGVATIEDVPAGEYTLRIKHKKHAPSEVKGQVVAERRLTDAGRVGLAGAGQVRGKVLGADGKQVRMAIVQHRKIGTDDWSEPTMAMNGSYRMTGLAAGKYMLRSQQMGQETYSADLEVEVVAGETAMADLQLPK